MKFSIELSQYSVETRKMMAKETKDPEFIDILVKDKNIKVVIEAIGNSEIKDNTVEELSKSENVDVKCAVAKKTKISRKAIKRLSEDKNDGVRLSVAVTPYEEPHRDIVIKLCSDPSYHVRRGLIQHGLIARGIQQDEEILDILSNDTDWIVKKYVAKFTGDSQKLDKLRKDKNNNVRIEVIKNPATKRTTIKKMKDDPDSTCRWYAFQILTCGKISY